MKKILSLLFALILCVVFCACGANEATPAKSAEAQKVDELILAIGEVTFDSIEAIENAQSFYDNLTSEQKAEVENYAVLAKAHSDYAKLGSKQCLDALDKILTVMQTKGEAHYNNDINNPYVEKYVYEINGERKSKFILFLDENGKAQWLSFEYWSEDYNDKMISELTISHMSDFTLYPDGSTNFKRHYLRCKDNKVILQYTHNDIVNNQFAIDSNMKLGSLFGKMMEAPEQRTLAIKILQEDYNKLNKSMSTVFGINLNDWGYQGFN